MFTYEDNVFMGFKEFHLEEVSIANEFHVVINRGDNIRKVTHKNC